MGVSGDGVATQALFKKTHELPFTLLADDKGEVAKAFGVPVKPGGRELKLKAAGKDITTKPGVFASRWTFVVGPDGKVIYKNTGVKASEDARHVLQALGKLGK